MIKVSFKNPKCRKLIYGDYPNERDVPKQLLHRGKVYFLYGRHY
jgi:hypothetical protein